MLLLLAKRCTYLEYSRVLEAQTNVTQVFCESIVLKSTYGKIMTLKPIMDH